MGDPVASTAESAGGAAHVFVDDLDAPELTAEDRHHLERVLRVRPGELVTAANGRGGWRACRLAPQGRLEPVAAARHELKPGPEIVIAFALTKGDRPEWVVQKLTEIGVDRIVPFVGGRTVVRWDAEKAARQVVRLRAVARAAAMQSRRSWLPALEAVGAFPDAVDAAGPAALAHPRGGNPGLDRPAVIVGPEGGFTDEELACGLPWVSLGSGVLRAETAAVAAGVLLCGLRGGVVARATGPPRPGALRPAGSGRSE